MSDGNGTWTTMHIGGSLPSNLIEEFLDCLHEDFFDISEGPTSDRPEEDLRVVAAACQSLVLQGHVCGGEPDAIKGFCVANNLTYWLHFDAGYEWDAGIVIWCPDDPKAIELASSGDNSGRLPSISIDDLRASLMIGSALSDVIDRMARFEPNKVPALVIIETTDAETNHEETTS